MLVQKIDDNEELIEITELFHKVTDKLGKKIDSKILSSVIAFNFWNIETLQSCEGHENRACNFPWIDFNLNDVYLVESLIWDFRLNNFDKIDKWVGFAIEKNRTSFRLIGYHSNCLNKAQETFDLLAQYLIERKLSLHV